MKNLDLHIVIEQDFDLSGEIDIVVQIEDHDYSNLSALAKKYHNKGECLSEEIFEQEMPDLYQSISDAVDTQMPDEIDIDEDEDLTLEDFSWYVQYPEDLCDFFY